MSDPIVFPSTIPRAALPLLAAGKAKKEFFVNEALARIDKLLHPVVEGEANDTPTDPAALNSWIVASAATGLWTGKEGAIACWDGEIWTFATPFLGMMDYDGIAGERLAYDGAWHRLVRPVTPSGGSVIEVEARAALASLVDILATVGILPEN